MSSHRQDRWSISPIITSLSLNTHVSRSCFITIKYGPVKKNNSPSLMLPILVPRAFYLPRRQKWPWPWLVSSATWLVNRTAESIRVQLLFHIISQLSLVLKLTLYTNCYKTLKLTLIVNFVRTKQHYWLKIEVGYLCSKFFRQAVFSISIKWSTNLNQHNYFVN